jgi:hypothetical protein
MILTLTLTVRSAFGKQLVQLGSCSEMGDSQWRGEAVNTEIEVSRNIGSRYQTTNGEDTADWEVLARAVVKCNVCELVFNKSSYQSKLFYNHTPYTWQHVRELLQDNSSAFV